MPSFLTRIHASPPVSGSLGIYFARTTGSLTHIPYDTWCGRRDDVYCLAFGQVGGKRVVVSGGIGDCVLMWDADSLACIGAMETLPGASLRDGVFARAALFVGQEVYSVGGEGNSQGEISIWDAASRVLLCRVPLPRHAMSACHVEAGVGGMQGGMLLVGDAAGSVHVIVSKQDDPEAPRTDPAMAGTVTPGQARSCLN
jgi:hypothetical protein